MSDLWRLSATNLAAKIRSREISAREAAWDALARLDAVNPWLNAVVEHRPDDVLAQADAIDGKLSAGEDPGPLAGVPVTIKCLADQVGYATTNGLRLQKDLIATEDNPVVANLRKAGAVLLGRTNTPAFSLRWFTNNELHGATKNPRDPSLTPGGSSGGAASAVAAGIGAIAHGSDIGGSIRYPAYACGVHGLRPSLGRVPAWNKSGAERGIGPQLMAVSGPLARTMADIKVSFKAMAAPDARDAWYTPVPYAGAPVAKKVALCLRPNGMFVAPEIIAALTDAARRLEAAGYIVEEVDDTPSFREATDIQLKLWLGDNFAAFADRRRAPYGPVAAARYRGEMPGPPGDDHPRIPAFPGPLPGSARPGFGRAAVCRSGRHEKRGGFPGGAGGAIAANRPAGDVAAGADGLDRHGWPRAGGRAVDRPALSRRSADRGGRGHRSRWHPAVAD